MFKHKNAALVPTISLEERLNIAQQTRFQNLETFRKTLARTKHLESITDYTNEIPYIVRTYNVCTPVKEINALVKIGKQLGQGGFGEVYVGQVTPQGKALMGSFMPSDVAIKKVRVNKENLNEINILKHSKRPHSCIYYGCFVSKKDLYIVMELVKGQDLTNFSRTGFNLTLDQKISITMELAIAIKEFHDVSLVHRDIKPENIIVNPSNPIELKLVDYGLSCNYTNPKSQACTNASGTIFYADFKTITLKKSFDSLKMSDWWSFGQVILLLFLGSQTQSHNGYNPVYTSIESLVANKKIKQENINKIPLPLRKMLFKLTNPFLNPSKRPKEKQILTSIQNSLRESIV